MFHNLVLLEQKLGSSLARNQIPGKVYDKDEFDPEEFKPLGQRLDQRLHSVGEGLRNVVLQ